MRSQRLAGLAGTLAIVLLAASAGADAPTAEDRAERSAPTVQEVLGQAVEAYSEGLHTEARDPRLASFRRSQRLFASLVDRGIETPDLYADLGNAALQSEDLGQAVLAYRRALRLDADHPRALQNLQHARGLLPAWVPRPEPAGMLDSLLHWHRRVPAELRSLLAAGCFAMACLLWALGLRSGQSVFRNAAVLPALAWLAIAGAGWLDLGGSGDGDAVVTREAVARAADSSLAPGAFPQPLPAGVELRILEQREPWLRVRLANGRDAWLQSSRVARVVPRAGPDAG
jgi:hypothetical protein